MKIGEINMNNIEHKLENVKKIQITHDYSYLILIEDYRCFIIDLRKYFLKYKWNLFIPDNINIKKNFSWFESVGLENLDKTNVIPIIKEKVVISGLRNSRVSSNVHKYSYDFTLLDGSYKIIEFSIINSKIIAFILKGKDDILYLYEYDIIKKNGRLSESHFNKGKIILSDTITFPHLIYLTDGIEGLFMDLRQEDLVNRVNKIFSYFYLYI